MDKSTNGKSDEWFPKLLGTLIGWSVGLLLAIPAAVWGFCSAAREKHAVLAKMEVAATQGVSIPSATALVEESSYKHADKFVTYFVGHEQRIVIGLRQDAGVITRSVRTPQCSGGYKDGPCEKRDDLADFTPEVAAKLGVPWTIAQAVEATCREIDGHIVVEKSVVLRELPPQQIELEVDGPKVEVPIAIVATKYADAAKGKVIRAGEVKVTPKGRAPYTTYEVVLRDAGHNEKVFTGVDLEEKVANGIFKVGDLIEIARGPKTEVTKEIDGKQRVSSRNIYAVSVIQST